MKKAFKIISFIFSGIMIAALVVLMWMGWLNISGKAFHVFGYAVLRVQTGSMAPEYEEGDFILSKECDSSGLNVGDIITFYSRDPSLDGMLNTHRITAIDKVTGAITTKGDAAEKEDGYKVYSEDIFGVATGKITFLREIANVLSISWVFAAIVFFPMLLLILAEIRNIVRAVKKSRMYKRLEELGLDSDDPSVCALAEKYGIEIFENAAKEIAEETNKEAEENTDGEKEESKDAPDGEEAEVEKEKEETEEVEEEVKEEEQKADENV